MPKVLTNARPELLAPAGGPESLRAAVNNGADAVYLGVDRLNARRGAENFTLDSLRKATRFAHLRGVKVYLTANVVIRPSEMGEALSLVDEAWASGVDAIIVQDLGLARAVALELPEVRLHASTQINAHNTATISELDRLGFSRVTLARELSLPEIEEIVREAPVEVEIFVHGALCFCYSGQCLLSSAVGGRSANRGMCAQPCRLPYELLDEKGKHLETPGRYLLSPRDLAAVSLLPRIVSAGVSALKIEGRMKSPEYVAIVTGVYRAALDRALADPEGFEVTEAELDALAGAFNRGFTTGYLDGIRDHRLMGYDRPNNRGVPVGRVTDVVERAAIVAFEKAVETGDTLEFWTRRGRFGQKVGALTVDGNERPVAPVGSRASMRVDKSVSAGDRVFRVASAALENAARRTFVPEDAGRTVKTRVSVRALVGEPLEIAIGAGEHRGVACGPALEPARTKPLTAADITEHVGRLGGTPFVAEAWDIELGPDAGAGFSLLHRVRREAVEELERSMLAAYDRRTPSHPQPQATRGPGRTARCDMPDLVVWTTRLATAKACLAAGAHRAIVPAWALEHDAEVFSRVAVEFKHMVKNREVGCALAKARPGRALVVGNLGLVRPAAEAGADVWAHWGLNAVNPGTVAVLAEAGAGGVWLSSEVSGWEVATIVATSNVPTGIAILGRQELMVTEHCVLMSSGPCSQRCGTCTRRERWYALRDRKGYGFPVISDAEGRSHIFNAIPLDLTRALPEILEAGVAAVRLDFTVEHLQMAQSLTRQVREALESAIAGHPPVADALLEPATAGHFFRGVR
ncbi:MAG: U32 family peptidase [Coriobacteriia bacterium]|nr:U32 family peptidase [Coriobacteriia bacterium]